MIWQIGDLNICVEVKCLILLAITDSLYIDTSAYFDREACSIEDAAKEAVRKASKIERKISKLTKDVQNYNSCDQTIQFVESISSLINGWTQWEDISGKYK
jgi:hypothetical protein